MPDMPDTSLNSLHLLLMKDVLPIGMAIVKRVKVGGVGEVIDILNNLDDSVSQLRTEGDSAASDVRERLDSISLGLGNPVVNVKVSVEESQGTNQIFCDESKLLPILKRIEERLDLLTNYLNE